MQEHDAIPQPVTMTQFLQGLSIMLALGAALTFGAALTACLS